jgi:ABC-type amino acid transport system permease subunit
MMKNTAQDKITQQTAIASQLVISIFFVAAIFYLSLLYFSLLLVSMLETHLNMSPGPVLMYKNNLYCEKYTP